MKFCKNLICIAAVLCGAVYGADITDPEHKLTPANPTDRPWWRERHEKCLAEIAKSGGRFDFVLIGDSITHNWEYGDTKSKWGPRQFGKPVAEKRFAGRKWLNLGFGGDGVQHVIWRCLNGELDGYTTPLVSILIGTNNRSDSAEAVARGIIRIYEIVRRKHPEATIVVNGILPRIPSERDCCDLRTKNARTNGIVAGLANGRDSFFEDWGPGLLKTDGTIDVDRMLDDVHPAAAGYELWADVILRHLKK